ncbi:MAG: ferritin family protein [Candidatus Woesearchaeota archaeon]
MGQKDIIRLAINEEDFFRDFYRAAAAKVGIASAKELLLKLSKEEKAHKERLQSYDFRALSLRKPLDLVKPLILTPIDEFTAVRKIFEFAIRSEVLAKNRYAGLAASVDDETARWLFNLLSVEEKRHERLLKDELKRLSF